MSQYTLFKKFIFLLFLLALSVPVLSEATVVRLQTTMGVIDVELYDQQAPKTVENFLFYVNRGAYNSSFFHRSMPGFVLQGGGYAMNQDDKLLLLVTADPVENEFSFSRSNVRGTVAMAKQGGDPDSATSQWFFNLSDNSLNLDYQNGGFTVFGRVIGNGMAIVDAITRQPIADIGGAFTELPLFSQPSGSSVLKENLVVIENAAVLPVGESVADADRLFNFMEGSFSQYLSPANAVSLTSSGIYFRYYSTTNSYLAVYGGTLFFLGPQTDNNVVQLGSLDTLLIFAVAAGY